jgi:hypothetical protein
MIPNLAAEFNREARGGAGDQREAISTELFGS